MSFDYWTMDVRNYCSFVTLDDKKTKLLTKSAENKTLSHLPNWSRPNQWLFNILSRAESPQIKYDVFDPPLKYFQEQAINN